MKLTLRHPLHCEPPRPRCRQQPEPHTNHRAREVSLTAGTALLAVRKKRVRA